MDFKIKEWANVICLKSDFLLKNSGGLIMLLNENTRSNFSYVMLPVRIE